MQSGQVLPCFHSHGWSDGQQHSLGNIKQQSIQAVIAGPVMQQLRNTIAQGKWHPFCGQCQSLESQGLHSPRQSKTHTWSAGQLIDHAPDAFELTHLALNWSNICNLTCTYCNPATSTAWQRVLNLPITHVRNDSAGLIDLVQNSTGTLVGLSLGGGEPLLQPGLLELLQQVNRDAVNVMVTTNLSLDLEHNAIYQELSTWPNVQWMISFDNVQAARFEYVRRGADWSLFEHNIQQLKDQGQQVTAHPAYSVYCAFDLVEYYAFCQAHNLPIFWCDLSHPEALDARRLSPELRQQARKEIDQVVALYGSGPDRDSRWSLDTLTRYQSQLTQDPETVVDPAAWHAAQEQLRSYTHSFAQLWPELL
jgi:organic radical activating enzyme